MSKFLRECYITVLETPRGEPDKIVKQVWGYNQNKKATTPTGLRLSFNIGKQLTEISDTATLRIWNLNQESRTALAQRSIYLYKTESVRTLQIQAGYSQAEGFGALFTGGIERVTNTRQGPDWITEIKASSALSQAMHNVFDKNWQSDAGTPAFDIANTLFKQGYDVDDVAYSEGAKTVLENTKVSSFLAYGNVNETIRKLIRGLGLVYSVDTGKIIVVEPGSPLDDREGNTERAISISEFSGLIGSPLVDDMGYEFRTLIDHRVSIGELVVVESQTLDESTPGINSLATVWTMNISGDTHEDDWYMNVKTMYYPPQVRPLQNIGKQPALQAEE